LRQGLRGGQGRPVARVRRLRVRDPRAGAEVLALRLPDHRPRPRGRLVDVLLRALRTGGRRDGPPGPRLTVRGPQMPGSERKAPGAEPRQANGAAGRAGGSRGCASAASARADRAGAGGRPEKGGRAAPVARGDPSTLSLSRFALSLTRGRRGLAACVPRSRLSLACYDGITPELLTVPQNIHPAVPSS